MEAKNVAELIEELGDSWWQNDSICRTLGHEYSRHVIGLHLVVALRGKHQQQIYSGFGLKIRGHALWVTAGHVVDNIWATLSHPDIRLVHARWLDNSKVAPGAEIPAIDFVNLPRWSATVIGHDFGYISLKNADLMLSGNPRFCYLDETVSCEQPDFIPAGHHVLGFPTDFHESQIRRTGRRRVSGHMEASVAVVPFERLARREASDDEDPGFWADEHSIFGRVLPITNDRGEALRDLDGVSGGPVFGVRLNLGEEIEWRLLGVQSAWLRSKRILRGVGVKTILDNVQFQP